MILIEKPIVHSWEVFNEEDPNPEEVVGQQ